MKVLLRSNSNIAKNIVRIGEDNLTLMFSTLGGLGLRRWRPNVLGDPNSQYNVVHEHVALVTFRRLVKQNTYAFMGVTPSMGDNIALQTRCYRSFVFSYLRELVMKEGREPGRVVKDVKNGLSYGRRKNVSNSYHFIITVLTIT